VPAAAAEKGKEEAEVGRRRRSSRTRRRRRRRIFLMTRLVALRKQVGTTNTRVAFCALINLPRVDQSSKENRNPRREHSVFFNAVTK